MHSKHKVARELSARAEGSREAAKNERKQRKGHPRRHRGPNLVPRVLGLLGQRFGRRERLWDNGIFIPRIVGFRFYCACLDS